MNKKNSSICFSIILLVVFQYGCTYTASFNRQPYVNMESVKRFSETKKSKTPEEIVFLKEYPKESYVVLGTLHAPEIEWTAHYDTDDLIKAMRKKASELGADAIVDFRFNESPSVHKVGRSVVPFKGLHAWGEAIIFIPEDKKKLIESN